LGWRRRWRRRRRRDGRKVVRVLDVRRRWYGRSGHERG
jgi:hypothetical protein